MTAPSLRSDVVVDADRVSVPDLVRVARDIAAYMNALLVLTSPTSGDEQVDIDALDVATTHADAIEIVPITETFATRAWRDHLVNPGAPADVDAISETVSAVFETLSVYGPSCLSLKDLNADCVQGEHLAATLRATFRLRHQVPGWRDALDIARVALQREGIDPADALLGLNK